MAYKYNPAKPPAKRRVVWEKLKKGLGSVNKGGLGGIVSGAGTGFGLGGPAGIIPGAIAGAAIGTGAGVNQGIQQYNNKDFAGNPSNINYPLEQLNPNATRHNENVPLDQLSPQARQDWQNNGKAGAEVALNNLAGTPEQQLQLDTLTPQQKQFFDQQVLPYILNQIGQGNKSLEQYGQEFDPFAAQAKQQFQQETIPGLAERFTAMGSSLGGSSFQNELANRAQNFQTDLAGQRAQYALGARSNAQRGALDSIGIGLRPQFEPNYVPRTQGLLENSLMAGLPQYLKYLFANKISNQSAPAANQPTVQ